MHDLKMDKRVLAASYVFQISCLICKRGHNHGLQVDMTIAPPNLRNKNIVLSFLQVFNGLPKIPYL